MGDILVLRNITKKFNDGENNKLEVLNIKHLEINSDETVAIVGKSGSGKTTLLNIIGLLEVPTTGEILYNSDTVTSLKGKSKSIFRSNNFGYVMQDFALIEDETAYENIEIPFYYSGNKLSSGERKRTIESTAEKLGVGNLLKKKVSVLSGGERQRVAIARAIVNKPKFILADEPTGNLDSETGERIFDILSEISTDGRGLVIVTHNMDIANQCDKILEIKDKTVFVLK